MAPVSTYIEPRMSVGMQYSRCTQFVHGAAQLASSAGQFGDGWIRLTLWCTVRVRVRIIL